MLVGNFCAIVAAIIIALYSVYSENVLSDAVNCPVHIYYAMMSCFIIGISYLASLWMHNPVNIVSVDPVNGLFGVFMTRYLHRN